MPHLWCVVCGSASMGSGTTTFLHFRRKQHPTQRRGDIEGSGTSTNTFSTRLLFLESLRDMDKSSVDFAGTTLFPKQLHTFKNIFENENAHCLKIVYYCCLFIVLREQVVLDSNLRKFINKSNYKLMDIRVVCCKYLGV